MSPMETSNSKYQPLYLKHRPQALGELVGQKSVVKTLSNALDNDRIAHAYLFTGPRGTGKTSSARILAKSINCDKGITKEPCLTCPSCESIANSSSTSVFEIDAASNNSVDDARSLIERAPLATQDGKHKLYIVDECHMLTKEAFNALLKTIEEPPNNVVFILATTEEHKVPPTIVSRCQRLMFRLVSQPELAEHLKNIAEKESIEITEDALDLMSRRSGGGLRDALGLLDQASLLSKPGEPVSAADLLVLLGALDEDILLDISLAIHEQDGYKVLEKINALLMQGREPSLVTVELAKHFLSLTKGSYLAESGDLKEEDVQFITGSKAYAQKVIEQAKQFDKTELSQIVELLDQLEQKIKRSGQPSLTLEMGILSICHRLDIGSVKTLTEKVKNLEAQLESGEFTPAPKPKKSYQEQAEPAPRPKPERQEPAYERPTVSESRPEPKPEPTPEQSTPSSQEPQQERVEQARPEPESENREEERQRPEKIELTPELEAAAPQVSADLDELWSDLLDTIHKRSIPTYSLVKMHANPLSIENNQLTLGVMKEFFQKSIEGKTEHIEQAYKTLTGEEIVVKVKVVQEAQSPVKKPDGGSRPKPRPRPQSPEQSPESSPEYSSAPKLQEKSPARVNIVAKEDDSEEQNGNGATSSSQNHGEVKTEQIIEEPREDSSLIKEAYRLFEGPGSRLIG